MNRNRVVVVLCVLGLLAPGCERAAPDAPADGKGAPPAFDLRVRGLEAAAAELVQQSHDDFHRLLAVVVSGDPVAAATRWLSAEIARRTRELLGTLGQPVAELVDFLVTHHADGTADALEALRAKLVDAIANGAVELAQDATQRLLRLDRDPGLGIGDLATVSDTIALDDPGVVVSAAVELLVEHSYVGDLTISVVHGDQELVVHDRTGGNGRELIGRLALPAAAGLPAAGNWELRIRDHAEQDVGHLVAGRSRSSPAACTCPDGGARPGAPAAAGPGRRLVPAAAPFAAHIAGAADQKPGYNET